MNELLKQIADNPKLFEALEMFFAENINTSISPLNLSLPDNELGQVVRAKAEADLMIKKVFQKLSALKTEVPRPSKGNVAR